MTKLYIANKNYSSWSLRPWVLMTELGIPFEEVLVPFETNNWKNFRAFSPSGKVPCLQDGSTTVWDSLAICEYLAESYPKVWPENHMTRNWARCAAAEMHSGFSELRKVCTMNCGVKVKLNEITTALQKDLDRLNELWEQGLNQFGGPFLAGEKFTAVDAFYAPVVFRMQTYQIKLSPAAQSYQLQILKLDSMQRWHQDSLQEPWIEPGHEDEISLYGEIIEDFRQTAKI